MRYVLATVVFLAFAGAALWVVSGRRYRATRLTVAVAIAVTAILGLTLRPLGDEHQVHPWPFTDIVAGLTPPLRVQHLVELIANLALFVPLGAVLAVGRRTLRDAVVFGFALSLAIELVQLGVPGRTTSADDVLLNTAGTALGLLAVAAFRR